MRNSKTGLNEALENENTTNEVRRVKKCACWFSIQKPLLIQCKIDLDALMLSHKHQCYLMARKDMPYLPKIESDKELILVCRITRLKV